MAYQVFARKYRPQTFAEIVGQEAVVRTLTSALRLNRIAQAYLFVGPRGTGKTSTARILAKALEASHGPTADFDPAEPMCQEIAEGRCLDVLEIDGASNNGVEQVRELRDNVRYTPAKGRYKIYIIDEVHMLTGPAFNALLKTLEEPPAHAKFIFATTEVHKLPTTILSRCQRFDLHRIPEPQIRAHLAHICGLEKVVAEPGALDALARYAEGGMRDAESALDQAISFYGDRVSEADVLTLFGLTGFAPVAALGRALAQGDVGTVLKSARELASAGKDLGKLSQDLLGFFRNLVIYQVSPAALENDISAAEKSVLGELTPLITRAAALEMLEELSHLEARLRYALAKDVVFEVALIRMSQLREKVSLESILESLGNAAVTPPGPNLPVFPASQPPPIPLPETAAPKSTANAPVVVMPTRESSQSPVALRIPASALAAPATAGITSASAAAAWKGAVEKFVEARPLEADTIRAVAFESVKADQIEVRLPKALEKKKFYLQSPRQLEILEHALDEALGTKLRIVYLVADGPQPPAETPSATTATAPDSKPAPPAPKLTQEAFVDDPVIQNALKIFEGKIVTPAAR